MSATLLAPADVRLRPVAADDLDAIVAANNAEIPAVSRLDTETLARIVDHADAAVVAEVDDAVAGFVLGLPAGLDFDSANYAWFDERLDDFAYIERIVVLPEAQGLGLGRRLYDHVVAATDAPLLVSEVNTDPRNDASLAFHDRYGFEPIGEMVYGEGITCAKLAKPLATD